MVHEQQIVPGWECKLHKGVSNMLAFSDLRVLKIKRQHSKVFAHNPNGIDFWPIFLLRVHKLVLFVGVGVNFIDVRKCDVVAAQKVVLLVWNGFLKLQPISKCCDDVRILQTQRTYLIGVVLIVLIVFLKHHEAQSEVCYNQQTDAFFLVCGKLALFWRSLDLLCNQQTNIWSPSCFKFTWNENFYWFSRLDSD